MDEEISGTTEDQENQAPVDPWAAAFAALEPKGEEAVETGADAGQSDVDGEHDTDATSVDGANPTTVVEGNGDADSGIDRGLDIASGTGTDEGQEGTGSAFDDVLGINDEAIQQYEQALNDSIREQAINDIAQEFLKRNIRQRNGVLGATLDDDDICKRDSDGVPHFYNPETKREFTGDNPRRQAQQWVDDYNKALADAFNKACTQYEQHLREDAAPQLAVMKFAPKYEKLDDIRKGMFENIVQDYEVKDNQGKVVGYSCDLDKALDLVERQVTMIQNYAKQRQQQAQEKPAPTGPALDMKTSSGAIPSGDTTPPSSLAEAMERIQDRELSKLKKN